MCFLAVTCDSIGLMCLISWLNIKMNKLLVVLWYLAILSPSSLIRNLLKALLHMFYLLQRPFCFLYRCRYHLIVCESSWCENKCLHKQRLVWSAAQSLITLRSVIPNECTSGSDLIAFFTITAILIQPYTNTDTQTHTFVESRDGPYDQLCFLSLLMLGFYHYCSKFKIHHQCTWSHHAMACCVISLSWSTVPTLSSQT